MNNYKTFASPKGPSKWLLWSLIFIFLTTLTTFTIFEIRNLNAEEPSVIRIILNSISQQQQGVHAGSPQQPNKFVLVNVENEQQNKDELLRAVVTQVQQKNLDLARETREAVDSQIPNKNKTSYYEEQTPVVVYSKTDQEAPLSYRQSAPAPYEYGSPEEKPYYDAEDNGDYANDDAGYYRPEYGEDSREDFAGPQDDSAARDSNEARSSQYDGYYRQWHYATPPPSSPTFSSDRKLQTMKAATKAGGVRDPYAAYVDDYEYMQPQGAAAMPQKYQKQQQQMQHYRPQASKQAVEKPAESGQEMNFLSILKTLKTLWDLYHSFAAAWNTMAEHHNKQEELAKQKYKQQQQLRINSKKPPKINSKTKAESPAKNAKNPKQTTTTTSTTTTTETASTEEAETTKKTILKTQAKSEDKVEPRKAFKGDRATPKTVEGLREKRQAQDSTDVATSTDVAEGRYIKGDPLKGYYDFVITEGSYKFWAVFQVGTALLIIYSTFAAIYYSKVNPLVSDYDYTDYLGGARSLSGGDLDFVDDDTASEGSQPSGGAQPSPSWLNWMPRTGHSLKFILDAIDKLPVDHAENRNGSDGSGDDVDVDTDATEDLNESTENKAM